MSREPEAVSPPTLAEFCRRILTSGDLEAKLSPPPAGWVDAPSRADAAVADVARNGPARDASLALRAGAARLPRPGLLDSPEARAVCLARFAHHELMAVELFAWALLRWPELPASLRAAWLGVLADEQRHCRSYLERLAAHGSRLADHPLSDYFWKHAPAIADSPHGPRAFLCAMGLTFEQANLDFTLVYRDGFRDGGDEASAALSQRVHDDEVRHVRVAAAGLRALSAPGALDVDAYADAVPFPLGPARAKARRFDAAARRRAGLSEAFITRVRDARSSQERAGGPAADR